MKRCFLILFVLSLSLLPAAVLAEKTVGTDVADEDITDFYFTCSTSTYPPEYQRYRFYVEDGKKLFFHEAREGGGWPQAEEDITLSGTVELSEEDWAAFCACLRGGTVRPRSDEVLDGDSGPWTYLYWTGDGGIDQEFSFASYAKAKEFEELCFSLAQNHVLTRFYFYHGGYMVPEFYEIILRNGNYYMIENEDETRPFDLAYEKEIETVIETYNILSWDGFDKSNPYVLDGESFTLELRYADGTSVRAYGDNSFPENYNDAMDSIEAILEKEKMSRMAGTYRYEGEGIGGDFTITLNADGTYTFYEGYLSSYMGGGTWSIFSGAVYLTEQNGYDLEFMFGYEDGTLIYIADGSDAFIYVKVGDGERFVRVDDKGVIN
ncbi:MAG: hypothetical protein IK127_06295 [Clostridia bacterium]|nr:hypothetical protein [Clostridia bacterium]